MRPASLVQLASAVADLGYLPNGNWLSSLYAATLPALAACSAGPSGSSSSSSSSSSGAGRLQATALTTIQLQVLAGAVVKIGRLRPQIFEGQKPPSGWLTALADASAAALAAAHQDGSLTAGQLSFWGRVMHRLGSLAGEPWPGPGRQWWRQYLAYSQPLLQAATPLQLCGIVEVLAQQRQQRLLGRLPEAWLQAFLQASRALLPGAAPASSSRNVNARGGAWDSASWKHRHSTPAAAVPGAAAAADLVKIGKALVQLGVLPSPEWRAAWLAAVESRDASMTVSWGNTRRWTAASFASMEAEQQQQQEEEGGSKAELAAAGTAADEAARNAADGLSGGGSLSSGSDWAELAGAIAAAGKPWEQQQKQQLPLRGLNHWSATYDDSGSDEDVEELSRSRSTSPSNDPPWFGGRQPWRLLHIVHSPRHGQQLAEQQKYALSSCKRRQLRTATATAPGGAAVLRIAPGPWGDILAVASQAGLHCGHHARPAGAAVQ
ncbi:hypothetical protein OEZ85_007058 [Tetradesmus obliquus]|uniref:Uncharacterized protein n=1 Tax=Tetradesmus obliquus TaxID=3088 RepID=A0ABY8TWK2_TETOB|nr:hypothetical protein OEZ85_007058 [Tetradesmus obliquus]